MRKFFFILLINLIAGVALILPGNQIIQPAQAADACDNPYMPFRVGDEIEYKNSGGGSEYSYTMKVVEVKPGFAKIEYEFKFPEKMKMTQNIFCQDGAITTDSYFDFSATGGSAGVQMKSSGVSGDLIPRDVQVGSTWTTKYDMATSYSGLDLPAEVQMPNLKMAIIIDNKVLSEEKVTVPAGSFKALKVESVSSVDMSMPEVAGFTMPQTATQAKVSFYQWWVKDVGMVKTTSIGSDTAWGTEAVKISMANLPLWDNPTLEAVTEKAVAPAVATAAVVNSVIATQSIVSVDIFRYLLFFLTQPLLLLKRKKLKAWGTVYNSLSGLPEDLAIIRLFDTATNKMITTQITDTDGGFSFFVPTGKYQIKVAKRNFVFPSNILKGQKEDDQYTDLYHGDIIKADKENTSIIPNIPIDPAVEDITDAKIRKKYQWQKYQGIIALASPALGGVSFLIKPSLLVGILFLLSIVTYLFFRRFAVTKKPKKWGKVSEEKTAAALPGTVMRIFALPFNRLFGYRVADRQGRYNFLVGNKKFVVTATKDGYKQTQTEPFDFSGAKEAKVIAEDIALKKI